MRAQSVVSIGFLAAWLGACEPAGEGAEHHQEEHTEQPHGPAGTVKISAAALERTGIRVEKAQEMALSGGVRVPAEVTPEPDRIVHVAPIVEGQVAEVRASIGEQVESDQVLAVLRSVALGETRAALSEAQAALGVAQANHARQQELENEGIGARRNLVEAEGALRTARARVQGLQNRNRVYGRGGSGSTTMLRSSIAGEVVQRHATVGEVVRPDQTLFVVADTRSVWINGAVYPQDIGAIRRGAPATFVSADLPGRRFQGQLDWVSPMMDEGTRTLPVRMVLDNPDGSLRPGLFGSLRVARDEEKRVVTVADTGVEEALGMQVVFVPSEEAGVFQVRPVSTGRSEDGRVEIVEGLAAGERYVAAGTFVLKSQLLKEELGGGHAH